MGGDAEGTNTRTVPLESPSARKITAELHKVTWTHRTITA